MKRCLLFLMLLSLSLGLFAVTNQIVRKDEDEYHRALSYFESQHYGDALKSCEDALVIRRNLITYDYQTLELAISPRKVQRAGDNISDIIPVLEERGESGAIEIINYYVKRKPDGFFGNSVTALLAYIKSIEEFPEVLKLMGDIYKIEGEYDFAESYYLKAYENQDVLNVPDEKYEILYLLAEISRMRGDYDKMELRYLNIVANDPFFNDKGLLDAMRNTITTDRENALEKFFELYRASNYFSLNAYNKLSEYYVSRQERQKALDVTALAVITGFTKISSIIEHRDILFEYDGLGSLFNQLQYYDDIVEWGRDNSVWADFNSLAEITYALGYRNFSLGLYKVLAEYSPDVYWRKKAVLFLDTIS